MSTEARGHPVKVTLYKGFWKGARTGSWTGPPRGERAPRVGISSTVSTLEATQGKILSQSPTDATS